jgi:hypothetical protein
MYVDATPVWKMQMFKKAQLILPNAIPKTIGFPR